MYCWEWESIGFSYQLKAGSFLLRKKKSQKIGLISAKLSEAIFETYTILELPSSMYLNWQWVHLQWSEQVTFLPRN